MDQLTALRVFRAIVDRGSFAAAARAQGLSPSAVTKNMAELEAHVGARLLNRTTRRLSLTEAGREYHFKIVQILEELDEADRAFAPLQQEVRGKLRVTAPVTFNHLVLGSAIPEFLIANPNIDLELNLDDRRVDIVREGYDLAIRGSDGLDDSTLIARPLLHMDHVLAAAPDYIKRHGRPKSPADLAKHECIQFTLSGHADHWLFKKGQDEVGVAVKGRYKAGSSLAVREALLSGFGVSLIPRVYVAADLAAGRLISVLDDWSTMTTTVFAIYPSRRYATRALKAFVEHVAKAVNRRADL